MKYFEKRPSGRLHEIPESDAEGRMVSEVNMICRIMWTAEEEESRAAEESAAIDSIAALKVEAEARAAEKAAAIERLKALGISDADLRAVFT